MARILDYIQKQLNNLDETIFIDVRLKDSGFYEISKYISRNPNLINGGYNTKVSISNPENHISATNGISFIYLNEVRNEAKKSGNKGAQGFKELVQRKKDKKSQFVTIRTF